MAGRLGFALDLPDGVDRLAEREAGREIERDRHRRLLALMIDLQRPDGGTSLVTAESGIDWPDGTPFPLTPARRPARRS